MGWSKHHAVGLIYHDPRRAFQGYTLIANSGGRDAHLVDTRGRVCHSWHRDEGISYGYLLDNGNLLMRTRASGGAAGAAIQGSAIMELDWESNAVWSYANPMVHHDFVRMDQGDTLVIVYEEMPAELAGQVRGGRHAAGGSETMFGDTVKRLAPDGSVVSEWRSWLALDPVEDAICPLEGRHQWTHQNALNLTSEGDYLVSFRQIDTLGIVDPASGEFRWKWGPGQISHQHHPTQLNNGHVLFFDNGPHRGGATFSRVIEIDPVTEKIEWEYRGDPPISFYSFHISGAERQPNGNTLICEGAPGRIFEVTPDHEIVWEYVNPHQAEPRPGAAISPNGAPNSVFRAHRYAPDHAALVGKDLTPHD